MQIVWIQQYLWKGRYRYYAEENETFPAVVYMCLRAFRRHRMQQQESGG